MSRQCLALLPGSPQILVLSRRHALLFRDRFNMTGIIANVAPPLMDQLSSTPGALSQVSPSFLLNTPAYAAH
jgi:hypothetical protein